MNDNALEEKVKSLEKRIKELEKQIESMKYKNSRVFNYSIREWKIVGDEVVAKKRKRT